MSDTNTGFEGRTAVITGAARGIGKAIAEALGEAGATVLLVDIDYSTAVETAEDFEAQGIRAHAFECDIADRASVATLREAVFEQVDAVDILVNNAGIGSEHDNFLDNTDEGWDRTIDVNLTGAYNMSKAFVPHMVEREYGRIVNISSMAGRNISYHGGPPYTASKWGLIGLTKHMAWDLGEYGITVNAVCPGSTMTDLAAEQPAEKREATARKIPVGRWADPEDQAYAVRHLASDEAEYITGTVLEVDGGKQLSIRKEI